jgi:hypothetical protein
MSIFFSIFRKDLVDKSDKTGYVGYNLLKISSVYFFKRYNIW